MKGGVGEVLLYLLLAFVIVYAVLSLFPDQLNALRSFGVPVPYCSLHPVAHLCSVDYKVFAQDIGKLGGGDWFFARIGLPVSPDVIEELCSTSRAGGNVLAIVDTSLEGSELVDTLDSCGVRVKFSTVSGIELGSPYGYIVTTGSGELFTDCNTVIMGFYDSFMKEWRS